ncbi:MAG: beta-lactamase family protein [Lachnospiraceae bacterium]|nr:beta-lactamase family protein [Lachnospiraceae bacterium]
MKKELVMSLKNSCQKCLDDIVANKEAAGVNILIRRNDEDLLYAQSGYADISTERKIERDTIFRMYSMSKPITSAAVMILMQRGLIGLGEPVSRYLAGFRDQMIYDGTTPHTVVRPASIGDLMNMTSGLPYGNSSGNECEKRVQKVFDEVGRLLYTPDALGTVEIADRLGEAGVCFQPGSAWTYGTGADILGAIVEVVSGKSFGEFLAEELFGPLEMNDTDFWVPEDKRHRLASVYERRNGELELFETDNLGIRYDAGVKPAFESGGAGMMSTLDDYSKFARMLLNRGTYKGRRILNEMAVRYMSTTILPPHQQDSFAKRQENLTGYSYGALMRKAVHPEMACHMTFEGEYGWDGWLGTFFENIPSLNLSLVMGMQLSDPEGNFISEKVRNVVHPFLEYL